MAGLIVHEWIAKAGGSERVLFDLVRQFPDAKLKVLWADTSGPLLVDNLSESWIARTPLRHSKLLALPFMLPTWRHLRIDVDVDWILASSHLFAHHAAVRGFRDVPKLVYAHSPARYIWAPEHDHRGASIPARAAASLVKPLDRHRAQEAVSIAANSQFTRERIQRAWRRDAIVIHPPVDVMIYQAVARWSDRLSLSDRSTLETLPSEFILGASRFVTYKRLDVAIRAGSAAGIPVVIAGSGPDEGRLRQLAADARVPVYFVLRPSDELLRALYERSVAFVFAAIEDFGIMPVEAMALGTPVIAAGVGGAAESVVDGVSGAFLDGSSDAALARAVERALACDPRTVRTHALRFDRSRFESKIAQWVRANTGYELAIDNPSRNL